MGAVWLLHKFLAAESTQGQVVHFHPHGCLRNVCSMRISVDKQVSLAPNSMPWERKQSDNGKIHTDAQVVMQK